MGVARQDRLGQAASHLGNDLMAALILCHSDSPPIGGEFDPTRKPDSTTITRCWQPSRWAYLCTPYVVTKWPKYPKVGVKINVYSPNG